MMMHTRRYTKLIKIRDTGMSNKYSRPIIRFILPNKYKAQSYIVNFFLCRSKSGFMCDKIGIRKHHSRHMVFRFMVKEGEVLEEFYTDVYAGIT